VSELAWHFPDTLQEAVGLLSRPDVHAHGGGTGILRGSLARFRGLVGLRGLGLEGIRRDGGMIRVGASSTYAALARWMAGAEPGHILAQSLGGAATTPLRNRITIGGSISMFPIWSDLMGPLLALDAEVTLAGPRAGTWPLAQYVRARELRQGSLITEVAWRAQAHRAAYYRHVRTRVDHPAFTITVLAPRGGAAGSGAEAMRIVVTGCTGRFVLLDPRTGPAALSEVAFPARMGFSPAYLRHCAEVELGRAVARSTARAREGG
jgi:CO/xanthine dehydrogenase FAD-binding subunit